jgi:hypothetical protein
VCVFVFVTLVLSPGCSGVEQWPAVGRALATIAVPCSIAIDAVDDMSPSYAPQGAQGGFVALPSGQIQLGRSGSAGSAFEGFRFSKFGLLVRRDRLVSLEVVGSHGDAVLEFVHPDTPAHAVRVGPCRSDREWAVFAGGLWVTEPGCVELVAASGGESVGVWLPVGAPCDGVHESAVLAWNILKYP